MSCRTPAFTTMLVMLLASCTGVRPEDQPLGAQAAFLVRSTIVSGRVQAPAGYRLAEVFLADATGTRIQDVPASPVNAETGEFTLRSVPIGATYMVMAAATTPEGQKAYFRTLVRTAEVGIKVAVSPATTLVAASVVSELKSDLSDFKDVNFKAATDAMEGLLKDQPLPSWTDTSAVLSFSKKLASEHPELGEALGSLRLAPEEASSPPASASPSPTPTPSGTPAPTPTPTATLTPAPTPTATKKSGGGGSSGGGSSSTATPTPTPTPTPVPSPPPFATVAGEFLAEPRMSNSLLTFQDYVYLVGGRGEGNPVNTVEMGRFLADEGTFGDFAVLPGVTLATARNEHTSVARGNFAYVIGGCYGATHNLTVERAAVDEAGNLGTFSVMAGVNLTKGRNNADAVVIKDRLYMIGGRNTDDRAQLDSIEFATFSSDGGLSSFAAVPDVTLEVKRTGATFLVAKDKYLYAIGGQGEGFAPLDSVERAPIADDGSIGTFEIVADLKLTGPRAHHESVVYKGYLYVFSGFSSTADSLNVKTAERAQIKSDGTLGPFEAAPAMTLVAPRRLATSLLRDDDIFIFGGYGGGDPVDGLGAAAMNSIEKASF